MSSGLMFANSVDRATHNGWRYTPYGSVVTEKSHTPQSTFPTPHSAFVIPPYIFATRAIRSTVRLA